MIERKFIQQNLKRFHIKEFLFDELDRAGLSEVELQRTPVGDKIVIHASRPGLVVGKGGSNIKELTKNLKAEFDLDDPQIEIEEVDDPRDNATIMAEMIANNLERYGASRFKGIGHKTLNSAMRADALGAEIIITGKVPGSRARRWRFYDGYLKKCGETAITQVQTAYRRANLNSGAVGIKVKVMKGDADLPDKLEIKEPEVEEMPVDDSDDEAEEADEAAQAGDDDDADDTEPSDDEAEESEASSETEETASDDSDEAEEADEEELSQEESAEATNQTGSEDDTEEPATDEEESTDKDEAAEAEEAEEDE